MIPVRIDPHPWVQLGGHLLQVAGLIRCPPRDIVLAAGTPVSTAALRGLSGLPDERVIQSLAGLLGLDVQAVRAMTLRRWRTGLFGDEAQPGTAGALKDAPALLAGGVYCPVCIRDGHWDLRWKTGLIAVCLTHRRYVLARCPTCGHAVAPDCIWTQDDGDGSELLHGLSHARSCGHAADQLGERPSVRALYAQERVNRYLEAAADDSGAAATCRHLLRWLEYLHRAVSDRPYLAGNFVAIDGAPLADLLADALDLTTTPTAAAHPILLRAAQRQRARGRNPHVPPHYLPLHPSEPDPVCAGISQACCTGRAPLVIPAPGAATGTGMPQVMPISEFAPDLSDHLGHQLGYDRARMVAALAMAAPAGSPTWSRISASVGLAAHVASPAAAALEEVRNSGQDTGFWTAIDRARERVTALGIDFAQRAYAVEHDSRVLHAAIDRWPALGSQPTAAVLQWLMDRWACQYVQTIPASVLARTHKAPDYRDTVEHAIGDPAVGAALWRTWAPPVGEDARNVAA